MLEKSYLRDLFIYIKRKILGGIALVYRTWNLFIFVVFPIGERNSTYSSKQDEGPASGRPGRQAIGKTA